MSRLKTAVRKRRKTKVANTDDQQCSTNEACCEKIRESAYYKWEAAGRPCCDGVEFWVQAEAELAEESRPTGEAS